MAAWASFGKTVGCKENEQGQGIMSLPASIEAHSCNPNGQASIDTKAKGSEHHGWAINNSHCK